MNLVEDFGRTLPECQPFTFSVARLAVGNSQPRAGEIAVRCEPLVAHFHSIRPLRQLSTGYCS